ncbi:MAG: c-type cytochrome [Acidobacteriia bacterium]|nr:c-type cytochrome [Terriglobia bacterium]
MAVRPSISAVLFLLATALLVAATPPFRPPLGLDAFMPVPADNPLTPEKVELGRKLFLDPILSADRSVSCASCHDPERSFTDDRPKSVGVFDRVGPRRVPKLLNRGYGRSFFWDGRIPTLEEQVLQPVINSLEMDLEVSEAVARLAADPSYASEFREAFGRAPNQKDLARALASYVRTILSGDSRYDRYVAGATESLDEAELLGLEVFRGKGNCVTCHLGPNLTDERFHNTGIGFKDGRFEDEGRFTVSGRESERGAFKTPTLRNVAQTAPYMHDGSIATLEDVIDDYDNGGTPNPYLDREIRKLGLTETEKAALAAFMRTLTGTVQEGLRP